MTLIDAAHELVDAYVELSGGKVSVQTQDSLLVTDGGIQTSLTIWLPNDGRESEAYEILGLGRGSLIFETLAGQLRDDLNPDAPSFWRSFAAVTAEPSVSKIQIVSSQTSEPSPSLSGSISCRVVLPFTRITPELIAFGFFHSMEDTRRLRIALSSYLG